LVCYLMGQIRLDNKTTNRLKDRAMYRKGRRSRHHWYRPKRFNNRANARKEGRLMPSVQKRLNRHIWVIEKLKSICPVSAVTIETASFDVQKIKNPEIHGREYQQGDKMGYRNTKAYLFARENGICQYYGKKIEYGQKSHMHHIRTRADGGTDKPDNLVLLHDKCHEKLHKTGDFKKLKKNKQYKAETAMNVLRKRLLERFPDTMETFGYITSSQRTDLGLEKSHANDAFVIAGGTNQALAKSVLLVERHKNNRSLQVQKKGHKSAIRKQRYAIQPGDLLWSGNKQYTSAGITSKGKQVWIKQNGKNSRKSIAVSKITRCYHFGTVSVDT